MPTFAIGDLQGCHQELEDLLHEINFDPGRDRLWFTGDLVNRGPQSLACLRFVKGLGDGALTVLGNHDLHLLAAGNGQREWLGPGDTLDEILRAADCAELLAWLRRQPLVWRDPELGFTMLHAGLPPQWSLAQALRLSAEVEEVLRGPAHGAFFANMYGNQPDIWAEDLAGWERLRFIVNCFTRLRYCHEDGRLDFKEKGVPSVATGPARPWFELKNRTSRGEKILFGHWAALRSYQQDYSQFGVYPLDMGCVWGGDLAALRLEDQRYFRVPSRQVRAP